MGAPKGNQNARGAKEWKDAIRYVLAEKGRQEPGDEPATHKGLRAVARKFVEAAEAGEAWALKELGDRIDGKPGQAVDLSGELGIPLSGTVRFVKGERDGSGESGD